MAMIQEKKFNQFIDDISIERERRLVGVKRFDQRANYLWQESLKSLSFGDKQILNKAYSFAKSIKYNHPGLSSEIYFAHPLRVASLSIMFSDENPAEVGIIGILHNIFEVSSIPYYEVDRLFGKNITDILKKLTVDRTLNWDWSYKKEYYSAINTLPKYARIVKVIDKFDNLFILDLNPDNTIKFKYLEEIKLHIVPIIKKDLPFMLDYFLSLIINCEKPH